MSPTPQEQLRQARLAVNDARMAEQRKAAQEAARRAADERARAQQAAQTEAQRQAKVAREQAAIARMSKRK